MATFNLLQSAMASANDLQASSTEDLPDLSPNRKASDPIRFLRTFRHTSHPYGSEQFDSGRAAPRRLVVAVPTL